MGKRNSVLTIDSVTGRHAGNFTCQASNDALAINYTSELIVKGTMTIQYETRKTLDRIAPFDFKFN